MGGREVMLLVRIGTLSAAIAALLCFAVAVLLSDAPRLPPTGAPSAADVRRARDAAVELALAVAADGAPRPVRLTEADLTAGAVLANDGLDWLRIWPLTDAGELTVLADLRLADATWINLKASAEPSGAFPSLRLQAGAWSIPPMLVRLGMRAADAFVQWQGHSLPPIATMVRGFAVDHGTVSATLAVPQQLFRIARELLGETQAPVDPVLLRTAYGRLLAAEIAQPSTSLATQLRILFAARPTGSDPVEYNRAAFVALAMFGVDPDVRRLAGSKTFVSAPEEVQPPRLALIGREDLAKHFALSAAMGAAIDPHFTRAIGEWKELDDSLPGGSGFSFVDLAADRAGLHLGRAAIDPATAEAVAERLANVSDGMLLPVAARHLNEGMTDREFRRRYGGLETMSYAQTVRRVDRLLAGLPLYAPFVSAS